jgi:hypothetical protein
MSTSMRDWSTLTVSNTAQQCLPQFGNRRSFFIQNRSSVSVYVYIWGTLPVDQTEVTSSNGVEIPAGQNWLWDGIECHDGEIRIIAASAGSHSVIAFQL